MNSIDFEMHSGPLGPVLKCISDGFSYLSPWDFLMLPISLGISIFWGCFY